jgi:hypothetical protein
MKAYIYRPARTAMQSGRALTHHWRLDIVAEAAPFVDPLMGWTGMKDTTQELRLSFPTPEEAIAYAKSRGMEYVIGAPTDAKFHPKSYAANFASDRLE